LLQASRKYMGDKGVYAFRRFSPTDDRSILVVLNNSDESQTFSSALAFAGAKAKIELLHGNAELPECSSGTDRFITLGPFCGAVFSVTDSSRNKEVKVP
ncbi:MAG: hypothetical protein ABI579_05845, partial [Candidatus Sumerlaeota bacterium]